MTERRIESEVLSLPGLADLKPPPTFARFFEDIAPSLGFSELVLEAQGQFENAQARVNCLLDCLKQNPDNAEQFLKFVQIKAKSKSINLEQCIRLFGTGPTTDLVIAMEMSHLQRSGFEWERASGRPKANLDEMLKYARKSFDSIGENSPFAHLAYSAGLAFDVLSLIAQRTLKDKKKKFLEFNRSIFQHGLISAKIGLEISKGIIELELLDYVFPACLMHDIGKSVMSILDDSVIRFHENISQSKLPRSFRLEAEGLKLGITHPIYSSLMAGYFQKLNRIKTAVLFHHDPYLLKQEHTRNDYLLSMIVSLSSNAARNLRPSKGPEDTIHQQWFRSEVADFPAPQEEIIQRISKVVKTIDI